jgi:hypothetical protein
MRLILPEQGQPVTLTARGRRAAATVVSIELSPASNDVTLTCAGRGADWEKLMEVLGGPPGAEQITLTGEPLREGEVTP